VRRLVTAVVVAAMLTLSGCGRQVTGLNQPTLGGGIVPVGQTLILFETAGQLDFQNVTYLIVFNTTGNNEQPYAQGYQNSDFKNWSYFFIVGGGSGVARAPLLYQIYQDPVSGGSAPKWGYPEPAPGPGYAQPVGVDSGGLAWYEVADPGRTIMDGAATVMEQIRPRVKAIPGLSQPERQRRPDAPAPQPAT